MPRDLAPHHRAWLAVHLNRSAAWLRDRLIDGFDIHHMDGNHENNDPANLVLIEHGDHMALHNGGTVIVGRLRHLSQSSSQRPRRRRPKMTKAKRAKALAAARARLALIDWRGAKCRAT